MNCVLCEHFDTQSLELSDVCQKCIEGEIKEKEGKVFIPSLNRLKFGGEK